MPRILWHKIWVILGSSCSSEFCHSPVAQLYHCCAQSGVEIPARSSGSICAASQGLRAVPHQPCSKNGLNVRNRSVPDRVQQWNTAWFSVQVTQSDFTSFTQSDSLSLRVKNTAFFISCLLAPVVFRIQTQSHTLDFSILYWKTPHECNGSFCGLQTSYKNQY